MEGRTILYADKMTESMKRALSETNRRRALQQAYNEAHGITPESIVKNISNVLASIFEADYLTVPLDEEGEEIDAAQLPLLLESLKKQMLDAAKDLDFEKAAEIRDRVIALEDKHLGIKTTLSDLRRDAHQTSPYKPRTKKALRSRGKRR